MTDYIYSRVSTKEQNLKHQTADLRSAYPNAKVVEEKASGKNVTDRPKFKELIETVTAGDKIIVRELSRLGRNTQAILELFAELESKGVAVLIKNLQIDSMSATGKMVLTIMASVATMEREIMLERQSAGIALAKVQGKFKGRKADPKTVLKCKEAESYIATGMSKEKAALAAKVGIATLYRYLNKRSINNS